MWHLCASCILCGCFLLASHGVVTPFVNHVSLLPAPTTPTSPGTTLLPEMEENIYLWLPLIVVIVFTVIMFSLILAGRRAANCATGQQYRVAGSQGDIPQLENNLNVGFTDGEGGPPTPPPTYSMIERQTSYVSHISQTSSQISVPPTYEETIPEDQDPMGWRRRLRRQLSRSTSVTAGSLRRNRLFQRSMSAQESPMRRNRYSSDSSSQFAHRNGQGSLGSDMDNVFIDSPQHTNLPTGPAVAILENVSEGDETQGSALRLTIQSEHNPIPQQQTRPPLHRSISDVVMGQPTFTLGE